MKFYKADPKYNYWDKILVNKLTVIYCNNYLVRFFKNGTQHNTKNAAYFLEDKFKIFYLNAKEFGNQDDFTKKSWRKFVKLQAFL
jgi:hypothetical protein